MHLSYHDHPSICVVRPEYMDIVGDSFDRLWQSRRYTGKRSVLFAENSGSERSTQQWFSIGNFLQGASLGYFECVFFPATYSSLCSQLFPLASSASGQEQVSAGAACGLAVPNFPPLTVFNVAFAGGPAIAFDILVFALVAVKGFLLSRAQKVLRHEQKTIARIILEDGRLYFLCVFQLSHRRC